MDDLEEKWQQLEKEKKALSAECSAIRTKLRRNAPYRELADYEKLKSEMKNTEMIKDTIIVGNILKLNSNPSKIATIKNTIFWINTIGNNDIIYPKI